METRTSDSRLAGRYDQRSRAERTIERFSKGREYPCWYDPLDPQVVVLDKTIVGIGVVGLIVVGCIAFAGVSSLPILMVVVAVVAYRANRRRET